MAVGLIIVIIAADGLVTVEETYGVTLGHFPVQTA